MTRGAVVEAEDHYRRAIKLLMELPQAVERDRQELALQMALGGVLCSSRSWAHPETNRAFARALELAEKLGETTQIVAVLKGLVVSALGRGQFKLARELAERMLAERNGDRASLCAGRSFLGQALTWRAQYAEAQKNLELGSSSYNEADFSEFGIDACALAAIVAHCSPAARCYVRIASVRQARQTYPLDFEHARLPVDAFDL